MEPQNQNTNPTPQTPPPSPNPTPTRHDMSTGGMTSHPDKSLTSLGLAVVLIAVGVAGYMWYTSRDVAPEEKGSVAYTNLEDESNLKIPAGFPQTIPVEERNIVESYRVAYNDGTNRYVLKFRSDSAKERLIQIYSDKLLALGYVSIDGSNDPDNGHLNGWRDGSTIDIDVTREGDESYVRIEYFQGLPSVNSEN